MRKQWPARPESRPYERLKVRGKTLRPHQKARVRLTPPRTRRGIPADRRWRSPRRRAAIRPYQRPTRRHGSRGHSSGRCDCSWRWRSRPPRRRKPPPAVPPTAGGEMQLLAVPNFQLHATAPGVQRRRAEPGQRPPAVCRAGVDHVLAGISQQGGHQLGQRHFLGKCQVDAGTRGTTHSHPAEPGSRHRHDLVPPRVSRIVGRLHTMARIAVESTAAHGEALQWRLFCFGALRAGTVHRCRAVKSCWNHRRSCRRCCPRGSAGC